MPASMLRAAALAASLAVLAHAPSSQARSLQNLAQDIAANDAGISALWPGYWPPGQPFVLYRSGACVMRSEAAPEAGFAAIADASGFWQGKCNEPRFRGPMVLSEEIGGIAAPAVEIHSRNDELLPAATFLVHEAFHAFQDTHFEDLAPVDTDFGFPPDQELVRMKLRESSFLLSASDTDDRTRQIALVRAAIATREARLARMPAEARAIEDRYLRNEGTAEYVDVRTAALLRESERPSKYLQDALRRRSGGLGRTWEYLLRWQSYAAGAAAGLLLDRWEVDWKPHVAAGKPVYEILAIASGYDPAEQAALLEASAAADNGAVFQTAKALLRNDRAADKALKRYASLNDFTLVLVMGSDDASSFSTTEMHTVAGGYLVMRPSPFSSASELYDLRVNGRPVRMWNRQEGDPSSESRVDIGLAGAPTFEGCEPASGRCAAGTRITARGVELGLHAEHEVTVLDARIELRAVETAIADED